MATPYSLFIDTFIGKITDDDILHYLQSERDEMIISSMKHVCAWIDRYCAVDLTDRDEILGQFNKDIDCELVDIITEAMIIEWLKPILYSTENFHNVINTKEISQFSPANLLSEIRKLYEEKKREIKGTLNEYSFVHGRLN